VGWLFAYGGLAIAPVSIGGIAVGLLPFGACTAGVLALGAFAAGVWAQGGVAIGWQACGGFALAWQYAIGGVGIARDFALGDLAYAVQANTDAARQFIAAQPFYHFTQAVRPYSVALNLLWVAPLVLWRWAVARHSRRNVGASVLPE
jgi:hypothetical protein